MQREFEDLSEEEKKQFFNSKLFQKYHSYKSLTDGIKTLQEDDVMYDNLVQGVTNRISQNLAESTVRNVLDKLVNEVEDHTELVQEDEEDSSEGIDLGRE